MDDFRFFEAELGRKEKPPEQEFLVGRLCESSVLANRQGS